MLCIKPKEQMITVTHSESGAQFTLKPISPRKYQDLQKKSFKRGTKDEVDSVTMSVNVAQYAIVGWKGVGGPEGELECNDENKAEFGENLAFSVMPWITNQAMDLDRHIQEEVSEAKKG